MPKVKISEYSATANSNTDVASINIDEGCAPSGINNAIRAVMGHLKDFQQGTNGDPFNGPVNGTLGATTASTANVTTLTTSSTITHNGGTANGVAYLNGSKVLTTGSALVFNGTNLGLGVTPNAGWVNAKAIDIASYGSISADIATSAGITVGYNCYGISATSWVYKNTFTASRYTQEDGIHKWFNAASGTAGNTITFTQAMTLTASSQLLVNATSIPSSYAGAKLYVASGAGDYIAAFDATNATATSNYGINVKYTQAAPNNTANEFYACVDSSTTRFLVRSNGGIANYSANDVNLSDRREKTNFASAKSYLDVICAIPVQTFNYIDQNLEEDDGLTLGVVAQDVQAVAPELVMESNWAGKDEEPKMRLSIYQTDLQYALMKCIQEQQALITQLTARITALESA